MVGSSTLPIALSTVLHCTGELKAYFTEAQSTTSQKKKKKAVSRKQIIEQPEFMAMIMISFYNRHW